MYYKLCTKYAKMKEMWQFFGKIGGFIEKKSLTKENREYPRPIPTVTITPTIKLFNTLSIQTFVLVYMYPRIFICYWN